jgi:GH25 family lysozyme M1 (1,4-beta-N-acetylmuramidase)
MGKSLYILIFISISILSLITLAFSDEFNGNISTSQITKSNVISNSSVPNGTVLTQAEASLQYLRGIAPTPVPFPVEIDTMEGNSSGEIRVITQDGSRPSGNTTNLTIGYPPAGFARGIDISAYNYPIDWTTVSTQGLSFVYMRASKGESLEDSSPAAVAAATDAQFTPTNINLAKSANLFVGAYHFAYPGLTTYNTATREATWFVSIAGNYIKPGYLRPALDLEWHPPKYDQPGGMTPSELVTWVNTWMSTVEASTGVKPIIYTTSSFIIDHHLEALASNTYGYDLWVAHWCNQCATPTYAPWTKWRFWQYGYQQIPGIHGGIAPDGTTHVTDLDVFYGDTSQLSNYVNGITVPTVTNDGGASSITSNSAKLNGDITNTGGENPMARIYFGRSDGGKNPNTGPGFWDQYVEGGPFTTGPISSVASSLTPGTHYYYRCYASNSAGTGWASSTADFWTLQSGNVPDHLGNYKGNGVWAVDYNGNGQWDGTSTDRVFVFGSPTDLPVVGDWNNDGKNEIGNYKGNGIWALDFNGNGAWDGTGIDRVCAFGSSTDKPVVGDWNNDGKDELGNYKGYGVWALDYNGNGAWDGSSTDRVFVFGGSTDQPVVGDWNSDGKDELGNYKGNGVWALDFNGNGQWDGTSTDRVFVFGGATDLPVVGDWNNDGKDELGNYKGYGVWALDYNGNGAWDGTSTDRVFVFGAGADKPVVGRWA